MAPQLEEFLENADKKAEKLKEGSSDADDPGDIAWNAGVSLGTAGSATEAAEAVVASEAFSHMSEEEPIPMKAVKPKVDRGDDMMLGMAGDFSADSAIADEVGEDQPLDIDGFMFSAVGTKQADEAPEGEDVYGGGKPPDDDDDKKKRTPKKPEVEETAADKKAAKKAAKEAKAKAKGAKKAAKAPKPKKP